jgi:hypothetical protein
MNTSGTGRAFANIRGDGGLRLHKALAAVFEIVSLLNKYVDSRLRGSWPRKTRHGFNPYCTTSERDQDGHASHPFMPKTSGSRKAISLRGD